MIEYALSGSRTYWRWLGLVIAALVGGFGCYFFVQLPTGLGITGMSRDVTWGFYIAQFTFLVGVAASAVMLIIPYYLHNYKQFGRITILGEFLAIGSVLMCITFIVVDLGQPQRVFNVMLYPTTHSVMFYDMIVLSGYLLLNVLIGWAMLTAEYKNTAPPKWVKPLVYLSIPWAVSIHTVTAFLFSGLAARSFWHHPILAPRFLASAFASGPALLILLCMVVRKFTKFDPGKEALQKLAQIVCYAMIINVFFVGLEFFTAFYGQMPHHTTPLKVLFAGYHGYDAMVPWMRLGGFLAFFGILLLLVPKWRKNETLLAIAAVSIFVAAWIDKGLGLLIAGFIPSPLHEVTPYAPSMPELAISVGVFALGALVVTLLYKIATSVKEKAEF